MSLVKTLQFASRFRKKMGMKKLRKPKKPGLRGGMQAKRSAINMAYGFKGLEGISRFSKSKFAKKKGAFGAFATGRGIGHGISGQARAHFARRYPKTDFAMGTAKVAGIGALGAWILNDDDNKKS